MEKKKILIADDNEDILDSLTMLMKREGYDIDTTVDGNALLKLNFHLPDLILLDAKLANSDGRVICYQLKSKQRTKDIPIIIFSAAHEIETSAREAGADDFLAKPFTKKQLLSKVERLIGVLN